MNTVLTIAGSDCSGGAGIQADMKTIMAHGAYAMSVITALTAQNTMGISDIMHVDAAFIGAQMDAVFSDIAPDAVKIGMIPNGSAVAAVSRRLKDYHARNIVIDPVMSSTSGTKLASRQSLQKAEEVLFSLASLLTPNIPEAEALSSISITDCNSMQQAAQAIARKFGCAVLCKGGHQKHTADDVLYCGGEYYWFRGTHIDNPNTHGTGCTLSSAIASNLAAGIPLPDAVKGAKEYLTAVISDGLNLGCGQGPLNHGYFINRSEFLSKQI